jgi:hypothetical protein
MKVLKFLRLVDDDRPSVLSLTHIAVWTSIALLVFVTVRNHQLALPDLTPFLASVALYDQKRRRQAKAASEQMQAGEAIAKAERAASGASEANAALRAQAEQLKTLSERLTQVDNRTKNTAAPRALR